MLSLKEFKEFKFESTLKIIGGKDGTITGSAIYGNDTYIDIEWDDGGDLCDQFISSYDNSSSDDEYVGGRFSG